MVDLNKEPTTSHEELPENHSPHISGSPSEAERLARTAKKRKTIVIWLRIIILLFVALFFLSRCAMSKEQVQVKVMESCYQNVPFAEKWKKDLQTRGLSDPENKLAEQYCICMWKAPLDKFSEKQLQTFAKATPNEQLKMLGGETVFNQRDTQCLDKLSK